MYLCEPLLCLEVTSLYSTPPGGRGESVRLAPSLPPPPARLGHSATSKGDFYCFALDKKSCRSPTLSWNCCVLSK